MDRGDFLSSLLERIGPRGLLQTSATLFLLTYSQEIMSRQPNEVFVMMVFFLTFGPTLG